MSPEAPSPTRASRAARRPSVALVTAPAAYGGLERVVSGLAQGLVARGHPVVLIAVLSPGAPTPSWIGALSAAGIPVEVLAVPARSYLAERQAVGRVLDRFGVEVVHTHGYRPDLVHGTSAHRAQRLAVSTVHGFTRTGLRGRLNEWLQVRALRRFDAVVAVSRPLAERLRSAGVGDDRLVLIPNGLVPPSTPGLTRADARARIALPVDVPAVGWVGRVSEEKGLDVMLEAFSRMRTKDAHLAVVGDGPMLAAGREQAAALSLGGRVHFSGGVPDAAAIIGAFDVLALSSRREGTPMVLLEAGALGVPIVASAVGGVPDLLGTDGGSLVRPDDPMALAEALDLALRDRANSLAAAERLKRRLAERAASDDWMRRYSALYATLLESRASHGARGPTH